MKEELQGLKGTKEKEETSALPALKVFKAIKVNPEEMASQEFQAYQDLPVRLEHLNLHLMTYVFEISLFSLPKKSE